MVRCQRHRHATAIALGFGASALCCGHSHPAAPPPARPPADRTTRLCEAPGQAPPLTARFAGLLPLAQGGLLATLVGSDPDQVGSLLDGLGLLGASLTPWGSSGLVRFVPGINRRGAEDFERALRSRLPTAQVVESAVLSPRARLAVPGAGRIPAPK
jgi:hypothetical protein